MLSNMTFMIRRIGSRTREVLPRTILAVALAGVVVAFRPTPSSGADPEIAARVNGEPVTRVELARLLNDPLARRALEEELGSRGPEAGELERLALRNLIHRRLLLQEAGRRRFTVTEKELDQALSALRGRFGDVEGFGAWMRERGLDDKTLRDTLGAQVLETRVWSALAEGVSLTEEEVKGHYEAHKDDLAIGEEVRLRIIAVGSRAEAEEILAALRKGENFGRLARTRSKGIRAGQGGDTGWGDARTLPPPLGQAVAALKEGDVAGPLQRGEDEFLLVGLQGRRPLRAKSLADARPEIERRLLPEKRREAVRRWLAEEERKAKIERFTTSGSVTNGQETGKGGQRGS